MSELILLKALVKNLILNSEVIDLAIYKLDYAFFNVVFYQAITNLLIVDTKI